ncbi:MAG: hypothetical protein EOO12_06330 [Chitinophagaceae bacterium]|nr:MAG: hypothetical protein EOO12_06330 [Chitinophagaceae bacterium]
MSPYLKLLGLFTLTVYILYFLARRRKRPAAADPGEGAARLHLFKLGADRYPVLFDHCDFRDRSYAEEVPPDVSDLQAAAAVMGAGTLVLLANRAELQETVRTLLYYQDPALCGGRRLAQALPLDATTLKYHVLEGHVFLYVSRSNPEQYVFTIEEPAVSHPPTS